MYKTVFKKCCYMYSLLADELRALCNQMSSKYSHKKRTWNMLMVNSEYSQYSCPIIFQYAPMGMHLKLIQYQISCAKANRLDVFR